MAASTESDGNDTDGNTRGRGLGTTLFIGVDARVAILLDDNKRENGNDNDDNDGNIIEGTFAIDVIACHRNAHTI
jgi:hypothetical protein